MIKFDVARIAWEKMGGLVPTIIQDIDTGSVLMLAYMNCDALDKTLASGWVTFYSRSQKALWTKGQSSGNKLKLVNIVSDCDHDTLLVLARPIGPTCHKGTQACFDHQGDGGGDYWNFINYLEKIISEHKSSDPQKSYVAKLFNSGIKRIAQKIGEEGVEVALAAIDNDNQMLCEEIADLLFHLLILLQAKDLNLTDIIQVLQERNRH